ncbi:ArsR/SmtB family transcription factor [Microbulbifer aggregans]|uniref:ArsR/SmtB family transcription factor n=1 Tax=Microbulbifer aggregans TaxID=1769779 RepID=UPI001CFCCD7D|nr:helix-turn-helix domain-containing protein [Microbulbifer aggregans]
MVEAEIYRALGDPTRLTIVRRLAAGAPATIGELSKNLGISRQGARKQLQVLVSANVVHLVPKGRETQVVLDPATLQQAREFISGLEFQWDQRLEALKAFVEGDSEA